MKNNWEAARLRSRVFHIIRGFFNNKEYLEVETPLLSPFLIPESTIETFSSKWINLYGTGRNMSLIPSPEIWMKQLLAEGSGSIFQICKSFRNCEQSGRQHNPEFSMLEWYGEGLSCQDNITVTEDLLKQLSSVANLNDLNQPMKKMSMDEAFYKGAGFRISDYFNKEKLLEKSLSLGLPVTENDLWEEMFNLIFVDRVEPSLPSKGGLFLTDYPSAVPTLAKDRGNGFSDRWELYLNGVELANCYTEENRITYLNKYYETESELLINKTTTHESDSNYIQIISKMPDCSGVAMGLDRLLMAISGEEEIQGVIFFSFSDIIGTSKN